VAGPAYARNATERLDGFLEVMEKTSGAEPMVASGDFSADAGARAVDEWMRRGPRPTAIIATNDSVALGTLEALAERQLRVPADVALAGFDGVRLAASPIFDLTTVDQHIEQMGRRAVRVLLRQLGGPSNSAPIREVLPPRLLLRSSTEGGSKRGATMRAASGH